jgi:hypothetical protein
LIGSRRLRGRETIAEHSATRKASEIVEKYVNNVFHEVNIKKVPEFSGTFVARGRFELPTFGL